MGEAVPFTTADAISRGISARMLQGRRFRQLHRGVHVLAEDHVTFRTRVAAALLVLPDGVVSHHSAARLYGHSIGPERPVHISINRATRTRRPGIVTHRRRGQLTPYAVAGFPVTGPDRTIVDLATKVGPVSLMEFIESMLHRGLTDLETLAGYAMDRHLDGVRRTRRLLPWVRTGAESPRETRLRLMLVFAHLPQPACNVEICDGLGTFLARGDLVYRSARVLVEYDGWQHERDARQRQHDIVRRERLESDGWRVIVVTTKDMSTPTAVVNRVHRALRERGYVGPPPTCSVMWHRWFPTRTPQDVVRTAPEPSW